MLGIRLKFCGSMRIRQDQPNPADIGNGDPVVALKA
jgi:hypothetical protein